MRIKLLVIVICLVILSFIPSFKKNFNSRKNVTSYKELKWKDFRGISELFSNYDAEIFTGIDIVYDSVQSRFRTLAVIDRNKSWVNPSSKNSDELLCHEQYHFKITQYYAQKLNLLIIDDRLEYESNVQFELNKSIEELDKIHNQYDKDTKHSLHVSNQRKWEYKIDSLLVSLKKGNGIHTDQFSGGQIFLPDGELISEYDSIKKIPNRKWYSAEYDMMRIMTSFGGNNYTEEMVIEIAELMKERDAFILESFETERKNGILDFTIKSRDTLKDSKVIERLIYHDKKMYHLLVEYPQVQTVENGYAEVATSFMNSFDISKTSNYWLKQFTNENQRGNICSIDIYSEKKAVNDLDYCIEPSVYIQNAYIGDMVKTDNETIIIPYTLPKSTIEQVDNYVLGYRNTLYLYSHDSIETIFHVPFDAFDEEYGLLIGYTLKKDSVSECKPIYFDNLER